MLNIETDIFLACDFEGMATHVAKLFSLCQDLNELSGYSFILFVR